MEFNEFLSQANLVRFESLRPLQKVMVVRNARDGHERSYVGMVTQLRKPNAYVLDMTAEFIFEDRVLQKTKSKAISFRNSSDIKVYLLESVSQDARKRLAEERKAYANARRALQQARTEDDFNFSLLGISRDITPQEFKAVKKKIMLQWHPDRQSSSNLSPEEFEKKSKQYTDAISYVSNYLNVKTNRI